MTRIPTKLPRPAKVTTYQSKTVAKTAVVSGDKKSSALAAKNDNLRKNTKRNPVSTKNKKSNQYGYQSKIQESPTRMTQKVLKKSQNGPILGHSGANKPVIRKKSRRSVPKNLVGDIWSKVGVFFLILAISFLILIIIAQFFYVFFLPKMFPLKENTNILLIDPDWDNPSGAMIYFVHFNPELRSLTLVDIDPSTKVALLGGYSDYEIRSVYPLLELDGKDEQYLKAVYKFALNEAIDEVIILPKGKKILGQSDLKFVLKDEIRREWSTSGELSKKFLSLYFFMTAGANLQNLELNNDQWSAFVRERFSKTMKSDCSVMVVNSTQVSGLAAKVADIMSKSGFSITRTSNSEQKLSQTTIILYDDQNPSCVDFAQKSKDIFPLPVEIRVDTEATQRGRVGLIIVAGEDLI